MLTEALLFASGATTRMGKIEDGTAATDYEPEEHNHQISVSLGMAPIEWNGHKINIIDCPGYADFVGDVAPPSASATPRSSWSRPSTASRSSTS